MIALVDPQIGLPNAANSGRRRHRNGGRGHGIFGVEVGG